MRHQVKTLLMVVVAGVMLGAGWLARASIRDFLYQAKQPTLPVAATYQVASSTSTPTPTLTKPPSTTPQPPLTPPSKGGDYAFPQEINLAVPFLLQAPTHDWSQPYQDACEEAAAIMVDAYYRGRRERYYEQDGKRVILDLIAFEEKLLGKYKDTTAEETARLIREYFHYQTVVVREVTSTEVFKPMLAKGYPVIVPVHGKSLRNPYFRNGGPAYHMFVIKGYLPDGRWIVND
ncbi:MAG: C39 family peptidase, partial [Candidatus Uhrbacteria bacterium]|nr:C39 family peptidase [Candidatus Uhrbacteria bacterium]